MIDYLKTHIQDKIDDLPIIDNIYYRGTSRDLTPNYVYINSIKKLHEFSVNYSKSVQGLGKFYSSSILNAYSFIDFRETNVGNIIRIKYISNKQYNAKNIVKLIKILEQFGIRQ